MAYWTGLLGGEQPVLELPFDRPRPVRQSHRGAQFILELDIDLSQALRRVAQQEGATAFALLLASFQALLYRYSGQADIRVGVPIANRNRVEIERLIGFFVNTQVLKADLDGRMGFDELLAQARQRALEAQAHQDLPFEQLVEALQPERSLSHNPLFQVLFNYQSEARGNGQVFRFDELQMESVQFDSRTAQFDLTLDLTDEEQRFAPFSTTPPTCSTPPLWNAWPAIGATCCAASSPTHDSGSASCRCWMRRSAGRPSPNGTRPSASARCRAPCSSVSRSRRGNGHRRLR